MASQGAGCRGSRLKGTGRAVNRHPSETRTEAPQAVFHQDLCEMHMWALYGQRNFLVWTGCRACISGRPALAQRHLRGQDERACNHGQTHWTPMAMFHGRADVTSVLCVQIRKRYRLRVLSEDEDLQRLGRPWTATWLEGESRTFSGV